MESYADVSVLEIDNFMKSAKECEDKRDVVQFLTHYLVHFNPSLQTSHFINEILANPHILEKIVIVNSDAYLNTSFHVFTDRVIAKQHDNPFHSLYHFANAEKTSLIFLNIEFITKKEFASLCETPLYDAAFQFLSHKRNMFAHWKANFKNCLPDIYDFLLDWHNRYLDMKNGDIDFTQNAKQMLLLAKEIS